MKEKTFVELVNSIISQIRRMPIDKHYKIQLVAMLSALQTRYELDVSKTQNPSETFQSVDLSLYDVEEIHENCTVQVWRNSVTGEVSVGWWENEGVEE